MDRESIKSTREKLRMIQDLLEYLDKLMSFLPPEDLPQGKSRPELRCKFWYGEDSSAGIEITTTLSTESLLKAEIKQVETVCEHLRQQLWTSKEA